MIKQQGITLIGAIFVLVIVSLLGQYLVTIAGVQRQTSILALQSARAYQAANAGIEWAIGNAIFCSSANFTINKFRVLVTSTLDLNSPYNENGNETSICLIESTAQYGDYGQIDYVSRQLEATIND